MLVSDGSDISEACVRHSEVPLSYLSHLRHLRLTAESPADAELNKALFGSAWTQSFLLAVSGRGSAPSPTLAPSRSSLSQAAPWSSGCWTAFPKKRSASLSQ